MLVGPRGCSWMAPSLVDARGGNGSRGSMGFNEMRPLAHGGNGRRVRNCSWRKW